MDRGNHTKKRRYYLALLRQHRHPGMSGVRLALDRDAAIFLTLGQGSGMKHDSQVFSRPSARAQKRTRINTGAR